MERRNFIQQVGAMSTMAWLSASPLHAAEHWLPKEGRSPFFLPPAPPLEHKGQMDIRVWVRSAATGGVYSCVECAVAPRVMGPAPHSHKALDELMYVLEGTATVMVGDEIQEIPAGGWHFRPRQLTHTFWNASDEPLRFIDMYFNQDFEVFLERIFHELTPENGYARGSAAWKREHDLLNKKYGLHYPADADEQRKKIVDRFGLK